MTRIERLELHHGSDCTRVLVGAGAIGAARERCADLWRGRTVFLVSSPEIADLHGAPLQHTLAGAARIVELWVPDGEAAKTLDEAARLWSEMSLAEGKRDSVVVDLGGGSVGDLAGFVAACFLRGVPLIHVPTTLLAQVDASIGGKTGVDLPSAKNSVGAFHQPQAVICDLDCLRTLPPRPLRAGLHEVVKIAAMLDPDLFEQLEEQVDDVLQLEVEAATALIAAAIDAKIRLVERDPFEEDERRLLNFGHTLGHALETALGYERLLHGEAVAYGMRFAVRLARRRGLAAADGERIERLIARLEPPPLPAVDLERVLQAIARDKKAREDGLAWVLPSAIGRGAAVSGVSLEEVRSELETFLPG